MVIKDYVQGVESVGAVLLFSAGNSVILLGKYLNCVNSYDSNELFFSIIEYYLASGIIHQMRFYSENIVVIHCVSRIYISVYPRRLQ